MNTCTCLHPADYHNVNGCVGVADDDGDPGPCSCNARMRSLTVDEVRERVDRIKEAAGDPEAAHSMEDELRADVLLAIADLAPILGGKWAQEMASAVRQTRRIRFPRWCA